MASFYFACVSARLLPLRALATVSCISYSPWKVSHQGAIAFPRQSQLGCESVDVLGAPLLSLVCLPRLSRSACGDMHGEEGGTGVTGEGWRGRGELLGNFALATLYPWGCVAPAPSS